MHDRAWIGRKGTFSSPRLRGEGGRRSGRMRGGAPFRMSAAQPLTPALSRKRGEGDSPHICSGFPKAFSAASWNASLVVGWAWIVPATSSSRAPISIASENADDSSDTPEPTA